MKGQIRKRTIARSKVSETVWGNLVKSVAPYVWYRFREQSGALCANSGSLGNSASYASVTLGQTGKLALPEPAANAVLLDGASSLISLANNSTLAGLTSWEQVWLCKPSSAGEAAQGFFSIWGSAVSNTHYVQFRNSATRITAVVYNTLNASVAVSGGTNVSTAAWSLIFASFNESGDNKVHVRYGISGAVTEDASSPSTALTGTVKAPTTAYNVGNDGTLARTFAGLMDEHFYVPRVLTPAERLAFVVAAGV